MAVKEQTIRRRPSFLFVVALGVGLSLAAVSVNAQESHPSDAPPPAMPHPADVPPPPSMSMDMEHMMEHGPPHPRFSPADRAAFFDAHLAGLHAGLALTPDQEKLWPSVEAALRAGAKNAEDRMERFHNGTRPANAIAWLRQLSSEDIAKGETLKALADAADPLYTSLSEAQKHRLPFLLHGIRPHGFGHAGDHDGPEADDGDSE